MKIVENIDTCSLARTEYPEREVTRCHFELGSALWEASAEVKVSEKLIRVVWPHTISKFDLKTYDQNTLLIHVVPVKYYAQPV